MASGEIVETDDALVEREQGFQEVRTDEAGHTSDRQVFGS